jgi:hypothetical protein
MSAWGGDVSSDISDVQSSSWGIFSHGPSLSSHLMMIFRTFGGLTFQGDALIFSSMTRDTSSPFLMSVIKWSTSVWFPFKVHLRCFLSYVPNGMS